MTYQKGYTLIELLIVVTITGILITVGAGAYSRAQRRQTVKAATDTLLTAFQRAQKMSVIGDKDCSGTLTGYQVGFSSGGNTLTTTAICSGGSGTPNIENLGQVSFVNTSTFIFRPLGQGVYINGADTGNADFEVEGSDATYRISIHKSGTIRYSGEI